MLGLSRSVFRHAELPKIRDYIELMEKEGMMEAEGEVSVDATGP